eukprot:4747541-Prymnesium_polylepis.1
MVAARDIFPGEEITYDYATSEVPRLGCRTCAPAGRPPVSSVPSPLSRLLCPVSSVTSLLSRLRCSLAVLLSGGRRPPAPASRSTPSSAHMAPHYPTLPHLTPSDPMWPPCDPM